MQAERKSSTSTLTQNVQRFLQRHGFYGSFAVVLRADFSDGLQGLLLQFCSPSCGTAFATAFTTASMAVFAARLLSCVMEDFG